MDESIGLVTRDPAALGAFCRVTWQGQVHIEQKGALHRLECRAEHLASLCEWLAGPAGYVFATLIVEEQREEWWFTYVFFAATGGFWVHVRLRQATTERHMPSIAAVVPAADWHERAAADLFGLVFDGHPRLGPFVLHDGWPEDAAPMRRAFDIHRPLARTHGGAAEPNRSLDAAGAFTMPIGPVFSDLAEAVHARIETMGEDASRIALKCFYKYRAVEKLAEGQPIGKALLLAERFAGAAAFAHGLAFCQAIEEIAGVAVPPRARALRALLAELERLRSHAATITGICNSTALAVATSQAAILEEDLLRLGQIASGHRYLFGIVAPGGLVRDIRNETCLQVAARVEAVAHRLARLNSLLRQSSSFLDRLEEVGATPNAAAMMLGLVGPVARASGVARDLRTLFPYAAYAAMPPEVPAEAEGDGYARLRVFFREAAQSVALIRRLAPHLPGGAVIARDLEPPAGAALGAVEAPLGAAFHWVRLDAEGCIARLSITPPSFANWPGFQFAAEGFAFQDFPIILASFGLSNAECDR